MRLSYHVAELVGEVVFVFGEPDTTFTYNIVTNKWTTLPVGPPLWGYATSAVGENEAGQKLIFVFGGIKKDEYESDIVYEYNTATNTLTQRRELMPFTHSSGASTTLKQQGRSAQLNVFFFGGKSKNQILGATFQFSTPKSPRPGDLNLDGAVNALDVALLAARLAADPSALPCGLDCADVNQDGRVDILDLMEIALAGGGM